MPSADILIASVMVVSLLAGFAAMTRFSASPALVMPLVSLVLLALNPERAEDILEKSFSDFGPIALLFTAIAMPAHQLQEGKLFELFGTWLGRGTGWLSLYYPRARVAILIIVLQFSTMVAAAFFHNITAIFVMAAITIAICDRYGLPSRWILCGQLVASNLGGFSSRWGDTPNIIEAKVWNLSNSDFFEILPVNVAILCVLCLCVIVLTNRLIGATAKMTGDSVSAGATADAKERDVARKWAQFDRQAASVYRELDWRRVIVGLATLVGFITLQFVWRQWEIAWAAIAIGAAVMAERPSDRLHTLQSLGGDIYLTLAAVFVIAHAIEASMLGLGLHSLIAQAQGAPWAIVISAYFGTMLTEAASWASTAAQTTHDINSSHAAAWALGGGICAGSSSLLTAASAGLILWNESRRRRGHAIEFGTYVAFGTSFSLFMVVVYIAYTSLFF